MIEQPEKLRVLIATSTLAWGINLPARRVVILGINRGLSNEVDPTDVQQMVGRSGRIGLDVKGDATVLLPEDNFERHKELYSSPIPVGSRMVDDNVLIFHAIAEMDTGSVRNPKDLIDWHRRSLAHSQGDYLTEEMSIAVFQLLEKCHAIKETDVPGNWKPTMLGRISSWLYFDPRNVWCWAKNMLTLSDTDTWDNDEMIAWALASITIGPLDYVTSDMREHTDIYVGKLNEVRRANKLEPLPLDFKGVTESWALWASLKGLESPKGAAGMHMRTGKMDIERTLTGVRLIDKMWGRWDRESMWKVLSGRIKYGVSAEMAPLVAIPGIGSVRAKMLWENGFTSLKLIADPTKIAFLRSVLGPKLTTIAVRTAKEKLSNE